MVNVMWEAGRQAAAPSACHLLPWSSFPSTAFLSFPLLSLLPSGLPLSCPVSPYYYHSLPSLFLHTGSISTWQGCEGHTTLLFQQPIPVWGREESHTPTARNNSTSDGDGSPTTKNQQHLKWGLWRRKDSCRSNQEPAAPEVEMWGRQHCCYYNQEPAAPEAGMWGRQHCCSYNRSQQHLRWECEGDNTFFLPQLRQTKTSEVVRQRTFSCSCRNAYIRECVYQGERPVKIVDITQKEIRELTAFVYSDKGN